MFSRTRDACSATVVPTTSPEPGAMGPWATKTNGPAATPAE